MTAIKEGIWHGDITAIKSLLPYPYTFIYPQDYIKIGDIMSKLKRVCEQCGREFERYPSQIKRGGGKYCSHICQYLAHRSKVKRVCKTCGKEFFVWPSQIKQGAIYCSHKCQGVMQSGENNPFWKGGKIERICKECGKTFQKHPAQIKNEGAIFCSNECHNEYRKKREILTCETCGKEFEVRKSSADRKFCSFQCYLKRQKTQNRLTKPEFLFKGICQRNNLSFHYVGDGQLWIGKKGQKQLNPDFIEANGKKICIEIMGIYWHSLLLNRNLREDATLEYRKRHFRHYKWQPIFIWDTDLLRKDAEAFVLNLLKKEGVI